MNRKSKRAKALDITPKVKAEVWERDGGRCILCGDPHAAPNMHYIGRAQGGLGIPQNVVTGCAACHMRYDQTTERDALGGEIRAYLMGCYPGWNENDLIYRKGIT